jgi:Arc/MetJ-type ribon-helix-helix transcriptional regulator
MSIQIAVRLPDHMVHELDQLVADGTAPSRASVVEEALRRELRRYLAERDLRILEAAGEDTDLLAATDWAAKHFSMDD